MSKFIVVMNTKSIGKENKLDLFILATFMSSKYIV